MKIGIEVFTETSLSVVPGSYFRLQLTGNHEPVSSFQGEDHYLFSGFVLRGKRIAASGRQREYVNSGSFLGLGPWEAQRAELSWVEELLDKRLRLFLHTNLVKDYPSFLHSFGIKCFCGAQRKLLFDLPLSCPVLEVVELSSGKFSLELTDLFREREEKLKMLA